MSFQCCVFLPNLFALFFLTPRSPPSQFSCLSSSPYMPALSSGILLLLLSSSTSSFCFSLPFNALKNLASKWQKESRKPMGADWVDLVEMGRMVSSDPTCPSAGLTVWESRDTKPFGHNTGPSLGEKVVTSRKVHLLLTRSLQPNHFVKAMEIEENWRAKGTKSRRERLNFRVITTYSGHSSKH